MPPELPRIDLTFLGSGNAFGAEGRAFSSFLLNGRYLFDCGPTVLQQLRKASIPSSAIDTVFISHFHGDHFLGLPFLFLDGRWSDRTEDLYVVGPPGVEEKVEALDELAYPRSGHGSNFRRIYVEVEDGGELEVKGLRVQAREVQHVAGLRCFAFKAFVGGRSLVYSGDTSLCEPLLELVSGADVLVLECSCVDNPVHLSASDVAQVVAYAPPHAQTIVTHLDGHEHPHGFEGLHVASDLARFSF